MNADGKTVTELTLREPTGREIRTCGMPIKFTPGAGDEASMTFVTESMAQIIALTANVLPPQVDALPMVDWVRLAYEVAGFLGVTPTSSTDISNALGSGTATSAT